MPTPGFRAPDRLLLRAHGVMSGLFTTHALHIDGVGMHARHDAHCTPRARWRVRETGLTLMLANGRQCAIRVAAFGQIPPGGFD